MDVCRRIYLYTCFSRTANAELTTGYLRYLAFTAIGKRDKLETKYDEDQGREGQTERARERDRERERGRGPVSQGARQAESQRDLDTQTYIGTNVVSIFYAR